jgi:hypothetical protein
VCCGYYYAYDVVDGLSFDSFSTVFAGVDDD